jgi:hypothetical protein
MAQAGYCCQCKANVWLTADGTCPAGHPAVCISNVYDAPVPAPPPAAAQYQSPAETTAPSPTLPAYQTGDALCPVCREGSLAQREEKVFLGLGSKRELVCGRCGAVLVDRGGSPEHLELAETRQTDLPGWKRYAHHKLTMAEWTRVARGGISDQEQRDEDLADALTALREGRIAPPAQGMDAPVILKAGEKLVFSLPGITLREPRAVSTGVYGGPSIHIAKGVTIRTGAFQAQSHEELKDIDQGTLVLTTKRLVFAGSKRSQESALAKLISVDAYSDAVAIRREGKEKTEFYIGVNHGAYQFTIDGRSYSEPLSGLILKYMIEGLAKTG